MNRRVIKVLVGVAVVATAALGGSAIARATGAFDDGDLQLRGPEAERARAAALEATDGGTVNAVERDTENGATYEVEVTRTDGSTVDVRLDESFAVVVIEGDSETADSEDEDGDEQESDRDDADELVGGPQAERARAAALRAVGGGAASSVERDSDNAYEVEVTRKDGSEVDVDLDESFDVVPDGD
jgi:uncharacterized membrane protein YkoI